MRKKTKIVMFFLILIVLICSSFVAVQLKLIKFDSSISPLESTGEDDNTETEVIFTNTPPEAYFTYSNDIYTVQFDEQSTDVDNDSLTYRWDFGDGSTSTEKNPIHEYDCSNTNLFYVTLDVSDGDSNDTYTETILFGATLEIVDYTQTWIRNYSGPTKWDGYLSMSIKNTGNLPTELSYALIKSKEKEDGSSILSGKIRFNFTYTYKILVPNEENGDEGGGLQTEVWLTAISNNTLTINPSETVTLKSNPGLTYIYYKGSESFNPESYQIYIWLYEKIKDEEKSHTLYETSVDLH